jgi:hypothetical protein
MTQIGLTSYFKEEEPKDRIELSTDGLQNRCSTTELLRHTDVVRRLPGKLYRGPCLLSSFFVAFF